MGRCSFDAYGSMHKFRPSSIIDKQPECRVHFEGVWCCYSVRGYAVRVIRCPNCQEPLPWTANFCAKCGEQLSARTQSPHKKNKQIARRNILTLNGSVAQPGKKSSPIKLLAFPLNPLHLLQFRLFPALQQAQLRLRW